MFCESNSRESIPVIFLVQSFWSTCLAVEQNPECYSGAWVFRGTRVPVVVLFENLEDDVPANQFVELFPGVTLQQIRTVLEHAARSALTPA